MKLLFSEARPEYAHYIFPYAIWAFREAGETPGDILAAGFLPSGRELDRFYLCRHLRVDLGAYAPSSENRRILRKGDGITAQLFPREAFALTPERREFCRNYAAAKFGPGGMTDEKLDALFRAPVTTHVLVFAETGTGREVGYATLYVEGQRLAFYYHAFYDLNHPCRSLGLFMMASAVARFHAAGTRHLYLGTCYSESALYKTPFKGVEFFNGNAWSRDLVELKFLLQRQQQEQTGHLLESPEYRAAWAAELPPLAARSRFRGDPA